MYYPPPSALFEIVTPPPADHYGHGDERDVEVYDADYTSVIHVPVHAMYHRPASQLGVTRLVLCRNNATSVDGLLDGFASPNQLCSKGAHCKFVHADITGCRRQSIHVNYALRRLDDSKYARAAEQVTTALASMPSPSPQLESFLRHSVAEQMSAVEEMSVQVFAPNGRPPSVTIQIAHILATKGSQQLAAVVAKLIADASMGPLPEDKDLPALSHCAHYYFNRLCNRGNRCHFIHSIYLDSNAGEMQRAPVPNAVTMLPEQEDKKRKVRHVAPTITVPVASVPVAQALPSVFNTQQAMSMTSVEVAHSPTQYTFLESVSSTQSGSGSRGVAQRSMGWQPVNESLAASQGSVLYLMREGESTSHLPPPHAFPVAQAPVHAQPPTELQQFTDTLNGLLHSGAITPTTNGEPQLVWLTDRSGNPVPAWIGSRPSPVHQRAAYQQIQSAMSNLLSSTSQPTTGQLSDLLSTLNTQYYDKK